MDLYKWAPFDGIDGFEIKGIYANDYSGWSVSSAGDVNGDGIDDLIIGAKGANANAGESYVVYGSDTRSTAELDLSDLNGTNGFKINGINTYDLVGTSVSSAGDMNGDGIDDIIIGGPSNNPDQSSGAGESYVVYGSDTRSESELDLSSLNGINGFKINGIERLSLSGSSVSSAGDVNGDGLDDIIIAAPKANASYVVFGSDTKKTAELDLSSLDGTNGFQINGEYSSSVSSAGDVNGDGLDDIIIGQHISSPDAEVYQCKGEVGNGYDKWKP